MQLRLAKEAQEAARTAVELDPSNDLAHHLMGRWHFEMAQINFVLRQVRKDGDGAGKGRGEDCQEQGGSREAQRQTASRMLGGGAACSVAAAEGTTSLCQVVLAKQVISCWLF